MSGKTRRVGGPQGWSRTRPASPETAHQELRRILFWLRWGIILTILVITLLWPEPTPLGVPLWVMVALFALYNSAIEFLRASAPRLQLAGYLPLLDLLVLAPLYYLDTEVIGVIFTLFVLVLLTAAFTTSLRRTILYTLLTLVVVSILAPTLPAWVTTDTALRLFTSRLLTLTIVGIGAALLVRHLSHAQAATAHLHELERLRADFIASVSHDLHTPLTTINGCLGMLDTSLAAQLQPEQHELLEIARRNGERLQALIDDLLTYNQISAGVFSLERNHIDLRSVASEATSAVQLALRERNQALELDLPEPLPLYGDQRRLEQVIINLLSNATKHTPPGSRITLSGRARPTDIHLTISDNGPGIPADKRAAIFKPFYRFDSSVGGSGLGLAIVRKIVELHGGQIQVESDANKGTTFHIQVPTHTGTLHE